MRLLIYASLQTLCLAMLIRPETMAQAQPDREGLRYQAIKKINALRNNQGDRYSVPTTSNRLDFLRESNDTSSFTNDFLKAATRPVIEGKQRADGRHGIDGRRRDSLLSNAALDRFFAGQTVRYLTGKTDLSYYKTYFTASSGDGSFNLGRTITHKDTSDLEQVLRVTNLGFKTNLLNGLGSLYSGQVWNREVGVFVNKTWLNRGRIWYDPTTATVNYVDTMDRERAYLREAIRAELDARADAFEATQRATVRPTALSADEFAKRQAKDKKAFYDALNKEEVQMFLEREEASGRQYINYAFKDWFTLRSSVAGSTDLVILNAGTPETDTLSRNFVPVRLGFDYAIYAESFRNGKAWRLLFTASASVFNTTQARILARYGKDTAPVLGGKAVGIGDKTYWQGNYETIWQGSFQPRAVLTLPQKQLGFFSWANNVSLDLFADVGIGRYSTTDAGAGLLFTLTGKDAKEPVNVEVICKWTDLPGKLLPEKTRASKLQVGLSLGFPIDGMLNKL